MLLVDHILQAIRTLSANKLRSFLSILGLVIGVLSITVMVSLVEWLQNQIASELNDISRNTITLIAGQNFNPFNPQRSQEFPGFTDAEISYLKQAMPFVNEIEAWSSISEPVTYRGLNVNVEQMAGVDVGMDVIESIDIVEGRRFIEQDITHARNYVVVSSNFVEEVFDGESGVGKELIIGDQHFTVIGVSEAPTVGFFSPLVMYLPVSTVQLKFLWDPFYQYLVLKIQRGTDLDYALQLTQLLMLKRTGATHVDDAQFQVISTQTFIEQFNTITSLLQLALWGIGGIALLVGGIGVMNIMLVSVTERTREIGIRKAIGAKDSDIMLQFLTESIILWLFGCLLWVLASWGIITGLQFAWIPALMNFDTLMVAIVFSLSVWVLFGVWPARKAAKMKPIDALRYE